MTFDTAVLEQVKAGDREAIDQMIIQYRAQLVAIARELLSRGLQQKIDPEDLVQEVAMEVFEKAENIQASNRAEAFACLRAILRFRAANLYRFYTTSKRNVKREQPPASDPNRESPVPQQGASTPSEIVAFQEFMAHLSEREREMVHLRACGFSLPEIAEALEISPRTVARTIQRAHPHAFRCILKIPPQ